MYKYEDEVVWGLKIVERWNDTPIEFDQTNNRRKKISVIKTNETIWNQLGNVKRKI